MKTEEVPNKNEFDNKFDLDKDKSKKKFYILVLRVAIVNILPYVSYINYLDSFVFFELILFFSPITLIYRYFMVFHIDRLFFNKEWKNKKVDEYMNHVKFNN